MVVRPFWIVMRQSSNKLAASLSSLTAGRPPLQVTFDRNSIFRRLPKSRSAADRPKVDRSVLVELRAGIMGRSAAGAQTKKERQPRPLREPPPRGTKEQHMASAPDGARLKCCFFGSRARRLRLAVFSKAALNARAFADCQLPAGLACNRLHVTSLCSRGRPPCGSAIPGTHAPASAHESTRSFSGFPQPAAIFQPRSTISQPEIGAAGEIPAVVGAACASLRHRESLDRDSDAAPFLSGGGSIVIDGSGWSIGRPNVSTGCRKLN